MSTDIENVLALALEDFSERKDLDLGIEAATLEFKGDLFPVTWTDSKRMGRAKEYSAHQISVKGPPATPHIFFEVGKYDVEIVASRSSATILATCNCTDFAADRDSSGKNISRACKHIIAACLEMGMEERITVKER